MDRSIPPPDQLLEGCQIIDFDWRYVYVNQVAVQQSHKQLDELLGFRMGDAYPGITETPLFSELKRCMAERTASKMLNEFIYPDGSQGWFELRIEPIPEGLVILSLDVTGKIRAEEAVQRMNRLSILLNAVNQAIVRNRDLDEVYQITCRVAVEEGGFRSAWIGLIDLQERRFIPKAFAGALIHAESLLSSLVARGSAERSPAENALLDGLPGVCNDLETCPHLPVWQAKLFRQSCSSMAMFPLVVEDRVVGMFGIAAGEKDFFGEAETKLLADLAMNISFAVKYTQEEGRRRQAELVLRDSEDQRRLAYAAADLGILRHDVIQRRLYFDERARTHFGFTSSEISPDEIEQHIHPVDREWLAKEFEAATTATENNTLSVEHRVIAVDNTVHWISLQARYYLEGGRIAYGFGITRDITEWKRTEVALVQRLSIAQALGEVSATLRMAQTVDQSLPILLNQALSALNCDAGVIWLFQPALGGLRQAAATGWFSQMADYTIEPNQGIVGKVYTTGLTISSTELGEDPLLFHPSGIFIPEHLEAVCVPIQSLDEIQGALMISYPVENAFSQENQWLLTAIAEMIGATLKRIRLYEDTVRHLKRLEVLRSFDQVITSGLDLPHTLNVLLDHVMTELKVDAASIHLLQPASAVLNYMVGKGFSTRGIEHTRFRLGENFRGQALIEKRMVSFRSLSENQKAHLPAFFLHEKFVDYVCVPLVAKGIPKGVLEVFQRKPYQMDVEWLNFLETLAGQAAIAVDNLQLFENLQQANLALSVAYDATIEGWSQALDLRDKETEGHTQRVTQMSLDLAERMGLRDDDLAYLRWGALLHDIGKMGIPDAILLKPGPLTSEEWEIMRKHPRMAFDLLSPISYLGRAIEIPYCHHEHWDGTGYPRGLAGLDIPLSARIFSIVDVWDALLSDRPYRPAWSVERALAHIREQSGKMFDPDVVDEFICMVEDEMLVPAR